MKSLRMPLVFSALCGLIPQSFGNDGLKHPAVLRAGFIYESAPFPQCHASTIVEPHGGGLVAAWFGGTHERHPDVGIWVSRFEAGRWTQPFEVANGVQHAAKRYPTWNPVLFQPKDGPLMLFYKAGPSPREWWGMLTVSHDSGRTWSEPRRLPEDVLGPVKNKPVQFPDGTLLAASSTESAELGWRVHFERTRDLGRTWEIIGPINTLEEFNAIQPSILTHADGRLQILCRTREGVVATSWSSDRGDTWTPMEATSLPNPNSGTDALTLADGRHLIVYNPSAPEPERWGGPRWPLAIAVSDDGVTWRDVVTLEDEPAQHGYSYPAVIQSSDGRIHVTYTWKRERIRHIVLDPAKL